MPHNSRFAMRAQIALLDMGKPLDQLSMGFTLAGAIGLVLFGCLTPSPDLVVLAMLSLCLLAGVGEKYYALRVAYDSAIFRALLEEQATLVDVDAVLEQHFGRAPGFDKNMAQRCVGAKRLHVRQASCTGLQVVCLVLVGMWLAVVFI